MTSDDMSSSGSGKQRTSSSTFYDELDAIPSSPTVFGVKLKSTRQSRKSCESMSDKATTPTSPVSPISPREPADNHSSKFSYSHTYKKNLEKTESEKATDKISNSGNYGLKSKYHEQIATDQNKVSEKEIRGGQRNRPENVDSEEINEVEPVRLTMNRKADVVQDPEIAEQVQKGATETCDEATDILVIDSKLDTTYDSVDSSDQAKVDGRPSVTEINKHVHVRNDRDALPTSQDENKSGNYINKEINNTEIIANSVALSLHSGKFENGVVASHGNLNAENRTASHEIASDKTASDNTEFANVELVEETIKMSFKQNNNEPDTSEKTDANSNIIHEKAVYTENESGDDSKLDSENLKNDVSHVQMRRGKANDIETNVSNQYSDIDLSQVEMRKSSRSRSRGSYNTDSEHVAEARKAELSNNLERLRSLKGSLSLEDNEDDNTKYNQIDKKTHGAEYDLYEKKSSRKLDNLSSLCLNGDLDEPVFFEEVSSVKPKRTQLRLDAYTKLKAFIEQADKSYDVEQHRKSTAFAAVDLEKVLKDI